jgi:hypothetical protein
VWCSVIGGQLIGPYIFPQRLSGEIYSSFLQDELPAILEDVPLQTRWQIYYQHDGVPPQFSQVVRQYLNHKFRNRWIGRGCTQNWPPRSPDLTPSDYHVCKVTSSLVARVRKCIKADGGHFKKLAWVLNGESVTVNLTTQLNKCTMLLFPFWFIYCTLKTRNYWTVANWTHVYMTFLTQHQLWN